MLPNDVLHDDSVDCNVPPGQDIFVNELLPHKLIENVLFLVVYLWQKWVVRVYLVLQSVQLFYVTLCGVDWCLGDQRGALEERFVKGFWPLSIITALTCFLLFLFLCGWDSILWLLNSRIGMVFVVISSDCTLGFHSTILQDRT